MTGLLGFVIYVNRIRHQVIATISNSQYRELIIYEDHLIFIMGIPIFEKEYLHWMMHLVTIVWSALTGLCYYGSYNSFYFISSFVFVRRAGLLWSQRDFEWRSSVPLFKCLTVLEFSFILFDLCLLITFFNFIMNYVPIVTFWIFTYHKIWILSIMFCSIWSYWIIYFLACLEVSWRVVS